jgi:hypothetical protein
LGVLVDLLCEVVVAEEAGVDGAERLRIERNYFITYALAEVQEPSVADDELRVDALGDFPGGFAGGVRGAFVALFLQLLGEGRKRDHGEDVVLGRDPLNVRAADWLDENGFSRASFAYPKGAASPEVRRYVKRDYCAGRSTARGPETIPPRDKLHPSWMVDQRVEHRCRGGRRRYRQGSRRGDLAGPHFPQSRRRTPGASTEFNDDDFGEIVDHIRNFRKKMGSRCGPSAAS